VAITVTRTSSLIDWSTTEPKPRIAADDTDIRKLRVSDDDIDVPGFLKD